MTVLCGPWHFEIPQESALEVFGVRNLYAHIIVNIVKVDKPQKILNLIITFLRFLIMF
jgi:hypothetical protein